MTRSFIIAPLCFFNGLYIVGAKSTLKNDIPDLSGTWTQEPSDGKLNKSAASIRLVISHADPEIKITKTTPANAGETRTLTYYSDGRGRGKRN